MKKPVSQFSNLPEQITVSPLVVVLDNQRIEREQAVLAQLVVNFNNKSLTEKDAFLAVAEIACLRNLVLRLSKEY